jgi:hypothetical protein
MNILKGVMLYINLKGSGLKSDCSRLKNHFPAAYWTKNMFYTLQIMWTYIMSIKCINMYIDVSI